MATAVRLLYSIVAANDEMEAEGAKKCLNFVTLLVGIFFLASGKD